MPKQKVIKTHPDKPKQISNNFLVVHDEAVAEWVCRDIIDQFEEIPIVEIEETHQNSFATVDPDMQEKNHRYEHQGRIHANIYQHAGSFFNSIIDQVGFALPKGYEFGSINYMQIIKYQEESFFPFHKDATDPNDTATSMLFLNDDFLGGELTVAGHKFQTKTGTIVGFNNSTQVLHGVAPIIKGDRYVLAIWYGPPEEEE